MGAAEKRSEKRVLSGGLAPPSGTSDKTAQSGCGRCSAGESQNVDTTSEEVGGG